MDLACQGGDGMRSCSVSFPASSLLRVGSPPSHELLSVCLNSGGDLQTSSVPTHSNPELESLHSWCCLGVTWEVRNNSERELNLVRASHLERKGRIAFLQGPNSTWAEQPRLLSISTAHLCAGRGVRMAISNAGSKVRNLPCQELLWGSSLQQSLDASMVCNLYAICSGTFEREVVLQSIVQTESNLHFSPFLSLHRSFCLSSQRAFLHLLAVWHNRREKCRRGCSAAEPMLPPVYDTLAGEASPRL